MGVQMDFFHGKHQSVKSYNIKRSVIILNTTEVLKCGTEYILKLHIFSFVFQDGQLSEFWLQLRSLR